MLQENLCNNSINPGGGDRKNRRAMWEVADKLVNGTGKWKPATNFSATAPSAATMATYFTESFNRSTPPAGALHVHRMQKDPMLVEFGIPTRHEVKKQIREMKASAAPGSDGIPATVWKMLAADDGMFEIIWEIMVSCWNTETTPRDWSERIHFILLYKKGAPNLPENWRPIMVEQSLTKVWQGIISDRLCQGIVKVLI
jgi:hypothetical protein